MPSSKTCTKCGLDRPLTDFGPNNGKPHGRAHCKPCRSIAPRPVVDEGFEITASSSTVDADGALRSQSVKTRPERAPYAGEPPGHLVKGVSTLVDESGNVAQRWIKTRAADVARHDQLLAALASVSEAWTGDRAAAPRPAPVLADSDLLAAYLLGDPHYGMFAWGEEVGESFDLREAEARHCDAIDQLVAGAPPAEEAIICSVGDTAHGDNNANQTARSGNALDVDTRWGKVMRVIVRSFRRNIDSALTKHKRVVGRILPGNHDDHSSVMIALCLAQFYENEPRVTIETSPDPFQWHRFGRCLLGFVHGHMTKMSDLPEIMACDRPQDWAETEHRHMYTGHVHHDTHKDFRGMSAETLRILAPRDAWHHAKGYRSMQDAKCDIWHRHDGRIQRNIVSMAAIRRRKGLL